MARQWEVLTQTIGNRSKTMTIVSSTLQSFTYSTYFYLNHSANVTKKWYRTDGLKSQSNYAVMQWIGLHTSELGSVPGTHIVSWTCLEWSMSTEPGLIKSWALLSVTYTYIQDQSGSKSLSFLHSFPLDPSTQLIWPDSIDVGCLTVVTFSIFLLTSPSSPCGRLSLCF